MNASGRRTQKKNYPYSGCSLVSMCSLFVFVGSCSRRLLSPSEVFHQVSSKSAFRTPKYGPKTFWGEKLSLRCVAYASPIRRSEPSNVAKAFDTAGPHNPHATLSCWCRDMSGKIRETSGHVRESRGNLVQAIKSSRLG